MIETVNLKKVYKSKGGNVVNALDGVSLKLPDKGMVFLLGKSGSGKSTLLNVCGGLDAPTSGEVIIKGRSSKDFSQNDFDSYRNTLVGFVFQEYNILNEFSVENNIALALELQGKPKDKKAVAKILEEVDLEGFGHRKPNTLSGGQKQRIAIARALIKNPEIIMADEPTGALDSNTGKQVFDTLKKLSQTKLVIVVSHDREFAEQYGDRIIELKDGKVLSDISKTEQAKQDINDNISVVGSSVLCVNDGETLKEDDFKFIKEFLRKNKNAIICNDENDIKNIKKATRINSKGSKESFENTEETNIVQKKYSKEEAKFIRSRLPLKHAFTIGVSGLKNKPIRLLMTIFLCTFAFALFGLLSTMMLYDGDAVFKETMMSSDYEYLQVLKQYSVKESYYQGNMLIDDYEIYETTRMTEKELESLKKEFGDNTFGAIEFSAQINNVINRTNENSYYQANINNLAVVDKTNPLYNMTFGSYPVKSNEIAISSYLAETILYTGLNNPKTDKKYDLKTVSDIIGKNIELNSKEYKVVGIFNSGVVPEEYNELKELKEYDWSLIYSFGEELRTGIYQLALVSDEMLDNIELSNEAMWNLFNSTGQIYIGNKDRYSFLGYTKYNGNENMFNVTYFDKNNTVLDDKEIIVSSYAVYNLIESNYDKLSSKYKTKWDYEVREKAMRLWVYSGDGVEQLSASKTASYTKDVINFINNSGILDITIKSGNHYDSKAIDGFSKKVKVIGFFNVSYSELALVSDNLYNELEKVAIDFLKSRGEPFTLTDTDYVVPNGAKYDYVYLSYDHSESKTNTLAKYMNQEMSKTNGRFYLSNSLAETVEMVNETVTELSQIFLYVGIVMAVFAALLLSNFIAISISAKTREIGILRAVGARSMDVFKIFFSESFVIAIICIILSTVGGYIACGYLNEVVGEMIEVTLFVFGILSVGILVTVALLTTILATFLPVRKAAKKKPVDSIRTV